MSWGRNLFLFVFFWFVLGGGSDGAQGSFLMGLVVLGTEPGLASCKADRHLNHYISFLALEVRIRGWGLERRGLSLAFNGHRYAVKHPKISMITPCPHNQQRITYFKCQEYWGWKTQATVKYDILNKVGWYLGIGEGWGPCLIHSWLGITYYHQNLSLSTA